MPQPDDLPRRIRDKNDLRYFLEMDRLALGKNRSKPRIIRDEIWKFQILLRHLEFLTNAPRTIPNRIALSWVWFWYNRLSLVLGFEIMPNVFGPGLSIAHFGGGIVVNKHASIGANCRIHSGVNIGTSAGFPDRSPSIGDNAYIGPGAKLFGPIVLGSNISIGANAVVNKSFIDGSATLGGVPARVINEKGSEEILHPVATSESYRSFMNLPSTP